MRYTKGVEVTEKLAARFAEPVRVGWSWDIAVGCGAVTVGYLLREVSGLEVGEWPYSTFLGMVTLTALFWNTNAATVALIKSFFVTWYFFMTPEFAFGVENVFPLMICSILMLFVLTLLDFAREKLITLEAERAEAARITSESKVMFKELQHRVANNLTFLAAMMQIQRKKAQTKEAHDVLDASIKRVHSIAKLHRILANPEIDPAHLEDTFRQIINYLIEGDVHDVTTHVVIDSVALDGRQTTALATILVELVINSLKHAFDAHTGNIWVTLTHVGDKEALLVYEDSGEGIAAAHPVEGMGSSIIASFVQMISGKLETPKAGSSRYVVKFPVKAEQLLPRTGR